MKIKNYLKNASIGFISIGIYFLVSLLKYIILYIFNINEISGIPSIIMSISNEILLIALIILIFNKKIEKDFKDFKKNHQKYYKEYFKYYVIGVMVMLISNFILIYIFENGISGNETTIREQFKEYPLYIYISAVLFAPVLEELVFRQGIRNIIPNDLLFILASGIIFGGLHIVGNITSIVDILYIIPYSSLGIVFAYIFSKTDNIFVTIGLHMMHNGILMAIQVMVMIFG